MGWKWTGYHYGFDWVPEWEVVRRDEAEAALADAQAQLAAAEKRTVWYLDYVKRGERIAALECELAVWKQNAPTAAKEREALEARLAAAEAKCWHIEQVRFADYAEAFHARIAALEAEIERLKAELEYWHNSPWPGPEKHARPDAAPGPYVTIINPEPPIVEPKRKRRRSK